MKLESLPSRELIRNLAEKHNEQINIVMQYSGNYQQLQSDLNDQIASNVSSLDLQAGSEFMRIYNEEMASLATHEQIKSENELMEKVKENQKTEFIYGFIGALFFGVMLVYFLSKI